MSTSWREFLKCLKSPTLEATVRAQIGHLLPNPMWRELLEHDLYIYWKVHYIDSATYTKRFLTLSRAPFELWIKKLHPDLYEKIKLELIVNDIKRSPL